MRRALLVILVLAALTAAGGGAGLWWLHRSEAAAVERLDSRVAWWRTETQTAIPIGADRDAVERWVDEKAPDQAPDAYDRDSHAYVFVAEEIRAGGIGFPCKSWSILVTITLGDDGHVIRRQADSRGMCL